MKLDDLLLQSGNDIPFAVARVSIHQPRLNEIAYIGEEDFLIGSHFLTLDKNSLIVEDKSVLENQSDFNIFMSVMNSRESAKHKADAIKVLSLLFPDHRIQIDKNQILLQLENFSSCINEYNFEEFQEIVTQMFCLNASEDGEDYNPSDALAARIAEKIKKAKAMKAKKKGVDLEKVNIFSKYVSILAVGLQKDKNELMNYTIPQIKDEFKRYQAKYSYDLYIKAKLANAEGMEEVENWME